MIPTTGYSAAIITHERDSHLLNTIDGLLRQTLAPDEIVVVFIDQAEEPAFPEGCPVRTVHVERSVRDQLPLARARNAAAAAATTEVLVFLDVDCIPNANFAETICSDLIRYGGLVMGTPRYLPDGWTNKRPLWEQSSPHARRALLELGPREDFAMFWTLCFAIGARDFDTLGGFDERFSGYGGEDTDFAFMARQAGLTFALSSATVFHQHHNSLMPPLNHFDDIVTNAQVFREKWHRWAMERWLEQFTTMGLIDWEEDGETIVVNRKPSVAEIEQARQSVNAARSPSDRF